MENDKQKEKSEEQKVRSDHFSPSTAHFSLHESDIEEIALNYLQGLGYTYRMGTAISSDGECPERQYNEVVLVNRLRNAIDKLIPNIT